MKCEASIKMDLKQVPYDLRVSTAPFYMLDGDLFMSMGESNRSINCPSFYLWSIEDKPGKRLFA